MSGTVATALKRSPPVSRPARRRARRSRASCAGTQPSPDALTDDSLSSSLRRAAEVDGLIDALAATPPHSDARRELTRTSCVQFNAEFFVRIAARADNAESEQEKGVLVGLAEEMMSALDAIVSETQRLSDVSSAVLERLVKAAADKDGEFASALDGAALARCRSAVDAAVAKGEVVDGVLGAAAAWARKANEDKLGGFGGIVQRVLQLMARALVASSGHAEAGSDSVAGVVDAAIEADDVRAWEGILEAGVNAHGREAVAAALAARGEAALQRYSVGSLQQQVVADYVAEINKRLP